MIQQLFLSLINGISILFGLEPHSILFFLEKMDKLPVAGYRAAFWAGMINGVILLFLKFRKELTNKDLLICIIAPSLFYLVFCSSYWNTLVKDLRVFSWVFISSICLSYFFLKTEWDSKKLLYPITAVLAYVSQIPGSAGLFILFLFLRANKISVTSSILLLLLSLAPGFTYSFSIDSYEYITGSDQVSWFVLSLIYLIACASLYWSSILLKTVFIKEKDKAFLNISLGCGIALLFLTSRMGGSLSGEKRFKHTFASMGTSCEITIWDTLDKKETFSEVKELMDSIEGALSTYKSSSEINAMNSSAHVKPFKCSSILWQNLLLAEYAHNISKGGFDVTIGPLVKLWSVKNKRSELPTEAEIKNALSIVGFDKLVLNKSTKTVFFKQEGLKVDFGGLTKGWAVDKASELLYSKGLTKFIVNLGGNLYCSKESPNTKTGYKVGLKDPKYPTKLSSTIELLGRAVSTSGNYEQFIIINGKRYTHIIDPRTGFPVDNVDAVTVISPSATLCDILSTAIFVEGESLIPNLEQKVAGLSILFIDLKNKGESHILKSGIFKDEEINLHSNQ